MALEEADLGCGVSSSVLVFFVGALLGGAGSVGGGVWLAVGVCVGCVRWRLHLAVVI